ncbi:MAG: hypothetical protein AB7L66_21980, partial [Gemmatimonadales bacterium]
CDFTNTIVLLTSNLGVKEANAVAKTSDERRDIIMKVVQNSLRPEIFNRLGGVVPFNSLEQESLEVIVRMHLKSLGDRLRDEYKATLAVDDDAVSLLATLAYDPAYGARPVERTIDRHLLSPLSRLIIGGDVTPGNVVRVVKDGEEVVLLAGSKEEVDAEAVKVKAEEAARAAAAAAGAPEAPKEG